MTGDETGTPIAGIGEIAFRVDDLDEMQAFYEDVVGLELMNRAETNVFFDIAPGVGGHTQVLALFDRSDTNDYTPPDRARTTVDHVAFEIPRDAYESERARLRSHRIEPIEKTFEWVSWRSLFFDDPEGNRVELVCYDPEVSGSEKEASSTR